MRQCLCLGSLKSELLILKIKIPSTLMNIGGGYPQPISPRPPCAAKGPWTGRDWLWISPLTRQNHHRHFRYNFRRRQQQIELVFKRLKFILGLGHLKKVDPDGARSWIHGKLFVAFLIEALISCGESFFPWGYPLSQNVSQEEMSLERDKYDAAST